MRDAARGADQELTPETGAERRRAITDIECTARPGGVRNRHGKQPPPYIWKARADRREMDTRPGQTPSTHGMDHPTPPGRLKPGPLHVSYRSREDPWRLTDNSSKNTDQPHDGSRARETQDRQIANDPKILPR